MAFERGGHETHSNIQLGPRHALDNGYESDSEHGHRFQYDSTAQHVFCEFLPVAIELSALAERNIGITKEGCLPRGIVFEPLRIAEVP